MIRSTVILCLALSAWPSIAQAQGVRYNPYAPSQEDPSPVRSDGSVNWPRYFKSAELEARFQSYSQMGSCVGTRKAITDRLAENAVDVNSLREISVEGRIIGRVGAAIVVQTNNREQVAIVTHPGGVSVTRVEGELSANKLRSGMAIRTLVKVDRSGKQIEPMVSVDVVSPTTGRALSVKPDHSQSIVATIDKVHADHLHVRVSVGSLHNLTLPFDKHLKVNVETSALELADAGDLLTAKGHILSNASKQGSVIFADEVSVHKTVKE